MPSHIMADATLQEPRARAILEAWRHTARLAEVALECTRPTLDARAPQCTAIVFVVDQPTPPSGQFNVASVREALIVWLAVSRCRGFSLQENFRFWKSVCARCVSTETMTDRADGNRRVLESCSEAPDLVLYWRGRPSPLLRRVMNACFLRQAPPSAALMDVLQELAPFSGEPHQIVVECLFRVGPWASIKDTRELLAVVGDVATKIHKAEIKSPARATRPDEAPMTRLVGVQCIHGSCAADQEMELLESFLTTLPDCFSPDVRFRVMWNAHRDTTETREHKDASMLEFGYFLLAAIGNIKAEASPGALKSLDFSRTCLYWNPSMSCLGSLLPYAASLRELCVNPRNTLDWMWLVYAVFHPSSVQLGWLRNLSVRACKATGADWEMVRVFYERGCSVSDLLRFSQGAQLSPQNGQPLVRTVRTAWTIREASISLRDGSRLSVSPGCFVEVCDSKTPIEDLPNEIDVLIPGFGFARIPRQFLEFSTDRVLHGAPQSCITCLELMHVPVGASLVARLLRDSLKVLWMHPPILSLSDLATWSRNLESVDYVRVKESDVHANLTGLSTVSHMGIRFDEDTVDYALRLLEGARSLGLVSLRGIQLDGITEARQVEDVVTKCTWLRYLEISTGQESSAPSTSQIEAISKLRVQVRGPHVRRCFLAFLSVVVNGDKIHPVTSLDASVVHLIMAFAAPTLETLFIDGLSKTTEGELS